MAAPPENSLVVPHDQGWRLAFDEEAARLHDVLGDRLQSVHHIGSTAIPGILAKPIIDMLAVTGSLDALDQVSGRIEVLGYERLGEFGIEGRRYFRKSDEKGRRTHHLHVFQAGSLHIERHLAFRDYLKTFPDKAAAYSTLKAELEPGTYQAAKGPLVAILEAEALAWVRRIAPQALNPAQDGMTRPSR
jgi:GrpB-like predicted nucleotidyltransferase (UPF0157 family)